jgi:ABC-type phosphate/phosphonate transport system substrate-binding protein
MSRSSGGHVLKVAAVAYDPKVITIWEGFLPYFAKHGAEVDYVLYSNYDAQVDASLSGEVDVAWNSPLAWVKSQIDSKGACVAIAMRDSDRDLTTKIIVRSNSQFSSLADLQGKTIAVGASDSPQATLIPLNLVADSGLDPFRDCKVLFHNVMVGKHGDHVGGERDAARALASGDADAACVLDANYGVFINEGTLDPGTTRVLATTPPFDHCNFTVRAGLPAQRYKPFVDALLAMSFQDPEVRSFMEMEGLKRWLPARTTGYAQLEKAVARFNFYGGAAASSAT